MASRPLGWVVLNAALWMVVGCAATLLAVRLSERRLTLADLADEAARRMDVLELTKDQKAELARIRDEWRRRILAEENAWLDRLDQAAAEADAKVATLLTHDQARRFRELSLPPRTK